MPGPPAWGELIEIVWGEPAIQLNVHGAAQEAESTINDRPEMFAPTVTGIVGAGGFAAQGGSDTQLKVGIERTLMGRLGAM